MGGWVSKAIILGTEQATPAIAGTSLLVNRRELVKTMGSGLEMHQLVKVRQYMTVLRSVIILLLIITVQCSTLSDPSNGRVSQQGNNPGDRASYTCNSGYELVGQSTRTCQNNGRWSGDAPTCTQIVCRNLSNPPNGRVSLSIGVLIGSRATYTCNSGYSLVGDSTRVCQNDGTWTGRAPICRIIRCGGLNSPSNGQVTIIDDTAGGTAVYTCNSGYTLVGRDTRTCQEDGSWSGIAPICRRVRCDDLPDITSGQVSFSGSINFPGTTATYTCIVGYVLVGDATRTCLESGQWSGIEPLCTGG